MIGPSIAPGMKKPHGSCRVWVDRSNVTSLVPIAQHTGECRVVQGGGAAVFSADDVIDLVRETGIVFVDEAVLAPVIRAPAYLARRCSPTSLATGEDLARFCLSHSKNVLEFGEVF
jgi:hypothetical protein